MNVNNREWERSNFLSIEFGLYLQQHLPVLPEQLSFSPGVLYRLIATRRMRRIPFVFILHSCFTSSWYRVEKRELFLFFVFHWHVRKRIWRATHPFPSISCAPEFSSSEKKKKTEKLSKWVGSQVARSFVFPTKIVRLPIYASDFRQVEHTPNCVGEEAK